MSSSAAKNLERIQEALDRHAANCGFAVTAICMAPFEVERLGFDHFAGIPIVSDSEMGSGRLRLVCEGIHPSAPAEQIEAKRPDLTPA